MHINWRQHVLQARRNIELVSVDSEERIALGLGGGAAFAVAEYVALPVHAGKATRMYGL
jgi:hypothetical protein